MNRLPSEVRQLIAFRCTGDSAMPRPFRSILAALTIALGLTGCSFAQPPTPVPTQPGLPNPASTFCEGQGGRLEIRTDSTGAQTGVCVFADGSECDEWAFFRNECRPGYVATREASPTAAPVVEPGASAPEGWEVYTDPTLGYSFFYPAGSALEMDAQGRYLSVIGPVENNEHWPWFSIAHPDEPDYHPPSDAVLQTWLAEHYRLPGQVVGTRTIAGETAIHTRIDNGPQAYDDDRFYFVHAGQVYEIVVMHSGKEDWSVYGVFLDSFAFQN
jgi:putative hemolysin